MKLNALAAALAIVAGLVAFFDRRLPSAAATVVAGWVTLGGQPPRATQPGCTLPARVVALPRNSRYTSAVASPNAHQFAIEVARIACDNKSEDVVALDLRGISPVTDFVVIGTGTSERQIRSVIDAVREYGRKVGERPYGVAGYENATWILLDYVDVVMHMFGRPYREYYDLELLWGDAPRVPWARSETA